MSKRSTGQGAALVALTFLLGAMVTPLDAQHAPGMHGPTVAPQGGFPEAMHSAMIKMSKDMESAPMTGDPDRDFLAMMIPHHEGAVEMARLVLLHGQDPLVRRLAEEIIAAQQTEIVTMRQRLEILKAGRDQNPGGFPALGGTRGPDPGTSPPKH